MKHTLLLILAAAMISAILAGCKTSEANYRAAYEKAVASRADRDSLEQTIYGRHRLGMGSKMAFADGDSAVVKTQRVRVTDGGGGVREWLKAYNVVAGQMKQRFNALSLRERLADNGFPRAFVVETAEPYYYIIVDAYPSEAEAVKACADLRRRTDLPVAMRPPLPFVLHAPGQN